MTRSRPSGPRLAIDDVVQWVDGDDLPYRVESLSYYHTQPRGPVSALSLPWEWPEVFGGDADVEVRLAGVRHAVRLSALRPFAARVAGVSRSISLRAALSADQREG